jgi:HPt (histidine-containing phosphotransfer) domain-containing protein
VEDNPIDQNLSWPAAAGDRCAVASTNGCPKPFPLSHPLAMLTRHLHDSTDSQQPPAIDARATLGLMHDDGTMTLTPNTAGATVLDAQALARLRELDPGGASQLLERVVAAYLKSLERLLPDLARARGAAPDLSVIRHVSHTLKSSSASLGALQLAQRCADIETMARLGRSDGLDTLLDEMLADVAEARLALAALLSDS